MVGGITYEETLAIYNINKAYAGNIKVIIGGTSLHNLKSFVEEVNSLVSTGSSTVNERQRDFKPNSMLRNNLNSAMKDI